MKTVFVISAIVCVLIFFLICPVALRFEYSQNGSVIYLHYLFISKKIYPQNKKESKKKNKGKTQKNPPKPKEKFSDKLKKTLSLVSAASKLTRLALSLVSVRFSLKVNVVGTDAADTAITCGRYYALFSSAVGTLSNFVKIKSRQASFVPDYDGEKTSVQADGKIILYPICLLFNIKKIIESLLSLVKTDQRRD